MPKLKRPTNKINKQDSSQCNNQNSTNKIGKVYRRPWGNYKTLALKKNYQVKIITVNPNGKLSLQKHAKRAEHWIVVEGQPTITLGDKIKTYKVNEHIFIPIGALHRIENLTQKSVAIIEVQIGSYLGEDDIIRIEDIYARNI